MGVLIFTGQYFSFGLKTVCLILTFVATMLHVHLRFAFLKKSWFSCLIILNQQFVSFLAFSMIAGSDVDVRSH